LERIFMTSQKYRLGVDLGGTKTEVIVLDSAGAQLLRERRPTPQADYRATVQNIADMVLAAQQKLGVKTTVGLGIPGSLSPADGRVRNANSVVLNGRSLQADLETVLGQAVRIENDANCMAVSEAADGAATGASSVFGVIVGTGVGGGLVFNGQVISGHNKVGGEWGHNRLAAPEEAEPGVPSARLTCWCGRLNCNETWLSGPAFVADFKRRAQAAGQVYAGIDTFTAKEVMALVGGADALASACLNAYVKRLAMGLSQIINVFDPEVIVLGGGMSNVDALYEQVPKHWGSYVSSDVVTTRLVKNVHGDSSGVRGAAWLWN
jgi:fructokinase